FYTTCPGTPSPGRQRSGFLPGDNLLPMTGFQHRLPADSQRLRLGPQQPPGQKSSSTKSLFQQEPDARPHDLPSSTHRTHPGRPGLALTSSSPSGMGSKKGMIIA